MHFSRRCFQVVESSLKNVLGLVRNHVSAVFLASSTPLKWVPFSISLSIGKRRSLMGLNLGYRAGEVAVPIERCSVERRDGTS